MTRDPSDGSVKEKSKEKYSMNYSGLPVLKGNIDETVRLDKSRDWMKAWHAGKCFNRAPEQTEAESDHPNVDVL